MLLIGVVQLVCTRLAGARGEQDSNDETVESKSFGEDQDEDHADEQLGLLRVGPDAGVADDADGHAGGEAGDAAGESGGEVHVAVEKVVGRAVPMFWGSWCKTKNWASYLGLTKAK